MRYISETAAGYIYENSAKEHKGNTRGYTRPYYSGALGSSAGVPGRGRVAFEKEGRPVQSVCFSIDALYAGSVEVDIQIHGRRREGQGSTNR